MSAWLDAMLVCLAVLLSTAYAVYALGPKKLRGWVMTHAARIFGVRVLRLFSAGESNCGGCGTCDSANLKSQRLRPRV